MYLINHFHGQEHNLLSFYDIEGDTRNLYQENFFHSISPSSLSPHILKIKKCERCCEA